MNELLTVKTTCTTACGGVTCPFSCQPHTHARTTQVFLCSFMPLPSPTPRSEKDRVKVKALVFTVAGVQFFKAKKGEGIKDTMC